MRRRLLLVILPFLFPLFLLAAETQTATDKGVAIDLSVRPIGNPAAAVTAGEDAEVTIRVHDQSGAPLPGLGINGWVVAHRKGAPPLERRQCVARVATFTAGSMFKQPAVDLNVYHVVTLNDDATLTVVDPRFGFGGTNLLAMVVLPSPGEDWTQDEPRQKIFVAMPEAGKVGIVDARRWTLERSIDAGANVHRIESQPDHGYVWAANDSGVVAIDPTKGTIAARIPTGEGPHDLAVSDDSRWLFVTNAAAGTTSIVDVQKLRVARKIATGARPVSVAWSALAHAAIVAGADGSLFALDAAHAEPRAKSKTDAGVNRIRFAPGGRLAFVTNPETDRVYIVDATTARVIQTAKVNKGPFEVSFSETIAYIRHLGSEIVLMVTLANVGKAGEPVSVADFPGGQRPFGAASHPSPAAGIVPSPAGESGVLVTNPGDGQVYFYREGMAAPMGSFSAYSHTPRAAMVIDRSLRETRPAVYSVITRMPPAGTYDVALFVDSPRAIACLPLSVEPAESAAKR